MKQLMNINGEKKKQLMRELMKQLMNINGEKKKQLMNINGEKAGGHGQPPTSRCRR